MLCCTYDITVEALVYLNLFIMNLITGLQGVRQKELMEGLLWQPFSLFEATAISNAYQKITG